jgi:hypothetical protein
MTNDDPRLSAFLDAQARSAGGNVEIEAGLWALFAVPAADAEANTLAQSLLAEVPFVHDSGQSEDGQWTRMALK